jgi:catechol O-methyltransferase
MDRLGMRGGREMADIAGKSNGYTRPRCETRNNVTSEFGDGPALELGTYCGYSALRIARTAPAAKVFSVELAEANAANARQIWAHAGVADRITCVVGTIGDGGHTLDALAREHGFSSGALDFLFIDHHKDAYLADLQSILDRGWLQTGSIVVADNVKWPGAPKYREYMRQQQGKQWRTTEHEAKVEYQNLLTDLVLESEYLGG